jgi:hypothetical protein
MKLILLLATARAASRGTMRDHEDLSALEAFILELLLEDDQRAEEIARELDAHMASVIGTHPVRPERGH